MSKAFTRESDDSPESSAGPILPSALPPGTKNCLTPDGAQRFRDELAAARQEAARRTEAGTSVVSDPAITRRIAFLEQVLRAATIVSPPQDPESRSQARFGATVVARESSGEEVRYRMVGVDEIDLDRGHISWLSPVAKALLGKRAGDTVRLQTPGGAEELKILRVEYPPG